MTLLQSALKFCRAAMQPMVAAALCVPAMELSLQAQEPPALIAPAAPAVGAPALLERIVLLGASVTAGFDISEPFGGAKTFEYRLANYIEAALAHPHQPVTTQANAFFFLKPAETLRAQLKATLEAQPSLVVGLDTLFWFCYGNAANEKERVERFESGLRLMEEITVPMVLGDIPNASQAVGGILAKKQMPELSTIEQCNERLKAWAADRRHVTIFPLSRVMAAAINNDELRLGSIAWPKGKSRILLQRDGLHPTAAGLAGLAIAVLDLATASTTPPLPETVLRRDLSYVQETATQRGKADAARRAEALKKAEALKRESAPERAEPAEVGKGE